MYLYQCKYIYIYIENLNDLDLGLMATRWQTKTHSGSMFCIFEPSWYMWDVRKSLNINECERTLNQFLFLMIRIRTAGP